MNLHRYSDCPLSKPCLHQVFLVLKSQSMNWSRDDLQSHGTLCDRTSMLDLSSLLLLSLMNLGCSVCEASKPFAHFSMGPAERKEEMH